LPTPRDGVIPGHVAPAWPIIRARIRATHSRGKSRSFFHPRSGFRFIRTTFARIEPASPNIHLILLTFKRK
jgi:hypothetical protein